MFFDSGECVSSGCTNADSRDNTTIRLAASVQRIETLGSLATANFLDCTGISGSVAIVDGTTVICSTNLEIEGLSSWGLDEFGIFRSTSFGPAGSCPEMLAGPGIFSGGSYPNTVAATASIRTVAASVDCITIGVAAAMRFGFNRTRNGPCTTDAEYGIVLCSPGGKATDNSFYFDSRGRGLAADAIVKDVFCPTSFARQSFSPSPSEVPTPTPTPTPTP